MIQLCGGYQPFGDRSMLYSDMYHQYYPFFVSFRRALLSGNSLLYNWDVGMGMEYLGLMSYYLASPLNLLSILLPVCVRRVLRTVCLGSWFPVECDVAGYLCAVASGDSGCDPAAAGQAVRPVYADAVPFCFRKLLYWFVYLHFCPSVLLLL